MKDRIAIAEKEIDDLRIRTRSILLNHCGILANQGKLGNDDFDIIDDLVKLIYDTGYMRGKLDIISLIVADQSP